MGDTPSRRLLEMDPIAVLNDGKPAREQWEAISDLDEYFARIYTYYRERGLQCILASRIISVMTIGYLLIFTIFLWFINWDGVVHQCQRDLLRPRRLLRPHWLRRASPFSVLYFFYFFLLFLYWAWTLAQFVTNCARCTRCARSTATGSTSRTPTSRSSRGTRSSSSSSSSSGRTASASSRTSHGARHRDRILRKQNFLVMVNLELLPLDAPLGGLLRSPAPTAACMTRILEWNLFDPRRDVRPPVPNPQSFTSDVANLRRRFVLCRCLNLLLAPFVIIFMLIFTLLKHAEEFRRRPAAPPLPRLLATRGSACRYNELEHVFDARLASSGPDASAYVKQFPAPHDPHRALHHLCRRLALLGPAAPLPGQREAAPLLPGAARPRLLTLLAILSTLLAVASFDGLAARPFRRPMQPSAFSVRRAPPTTCPSTGAAASTRAPSTATFAACTSTGSSSSRRRSSARSPRPSL